MKIAIAGATGRMGIALIRRIAGNPLCTLVGASVRQGNPLSGEDAGVIAGVAPLNIAATATSAELFNLADAVIDFTTPEHSLELAVRAAQSGKVHIIGSTGFSDEQKRALQEHGRKARIVWSGNMSFGVNLLASLVEKAAALLDDEYDIEIVEMHHRHKVDAPSGTALLLGEAAARGRELSLKQTAVMERVGRTGPRKPGTIGFATLRGGDVVGDHTVIFAGDGERIELTHKSSSRDIYATGAIKAAFWAQKQKPGFYSMRDVLAV